MEKKEVTGEKSHTQIYSEKKEEYPELIRVEYLDPVLIKKADPRFYKPSLREAVGWRIDESEDDHLILLSDKPLRFQSFERLYPEVAFVIPKSSVLGVWEIKSQKLKILKKQGKST
jgi:hypothetical protein